MEIELCTRCQIELEPSQIGLCDSCQHDDETSDEVEPTE